MIFILAALLLLCLLAAARTLALPRPVVRQASREVVETIRRDPTVGSYAFQYVLKGPGGRDVGDHDADKLVVRAERGSRGIVVRVAPVDRQGRRTGRSRVLLLTR